MDNFSVDLDQALNELERQESEEKFLNDLKEKDVPAEILEETSIVQISNRKDPTDHNHIERLISLSDILESESDPKKQTILDSELENEINEIMQSLIMDEITLDETPVIEVIEKMEEVPIPGENVEELTVSSQINETDESPIVDNKLSDKHETSPIQIKRLVSIELEETSIEVNNQLDLTKDDDNGSKKESDTLDEHFSSPNEDSECYFDTIEISQSVLDTEKTEKTNVEEKAEIVMETGNEVIMNDEEKTETDEMINDEEKITETVDEVVKTEQESLNESTHFLESLNDLEKTTDISETHLENSQILETNFSQPILENIINESDQLELVTIETNINEIIGNNQATLPEGDNQTNGEETVTKEPINQTSSEETSTQESSNNQTTIDDTNIPIEVTDYQTEWSELTDNEKTLGLIAPTWMPDSETDVCLKCSIKFSFRTRRHHCRACGLIFCSKCCYLKVLLPYNITRTNEQDEALSNSKNQMSRCCNVCHEIINRVNNLRINMQKMSAVNTPISVLKKKTNKSAATSILTAGKHVHNGLEKTQEEDGESVAGSSKLVRSKSVRFSDGFVPGLENNQIESSQMNTSQDATSQVAKTHPKKKSSYLLSKKYKISNKNTFRQSRYIEEELITRIKLTLINNNLLPPILDKDEIVDSASISTDEETLIAEKLLASESDYLTFMLLRNLKVFVRIINFDCCTKQKCWLFVTNGLCLNGQEELVFILKCQTDEQTNELKETRIPREILYHIMDIYEKSAKGFKITQMNHILYDFEPAKANDKATSKTDTNENYLLDNKENVGFLYYNPTEFHFKCCLKSFAVYLPEEKFLIGYLLQKWEIPWAKLFPLRLFLSIGECFKTYPTSLISDRYRKSVFGDIGHTIMSLLCDVRNFQYTIAQIDGLKIQLESSCTRIIIPESQYDLIVKSILTSNDYVFSLACLQMDDSCYSHLVAVENENLASFTSKTISFNQSENNESINKVTGAAFVVFNGALKANLTNNAKISVIEDGLMIQIETETMNKLKQALQSMKQFKIDSLKPQVNLSHQTHNENNVISIEWTKDSPVNKGVYSIIDKRSLSGVKSLRLTNTYDYVNESKGIRWTEIYLIQIEDDSNSINDNNFNLNRFADMCSTAFCTALTPLLDQLVNLQIIHLTSGNNFLPVCSNAIYANESKQSELVNYAKLINPFRVALRVQIDKDQVGYLIGMNGNQINEDVFLANLDNELIQLLNHASSFNINIVLEFVFYVQERFNCSNKYVIQA